MGDDRSVRLAFGDFDCEINGYNDPAPLLGKIVSIYASAAKQNPGLTSGGGPDAAEVRERFAETVMAEADRLGASVAARNGAVTVPRRAHEDAPDCEAPPAHLAGMDPALLAEFAAMRARLRE